MKIYKYRIFYQWATAEGLTDELLKAAVSEITNGLYEANLGSGLYKKRIAQPGKGKRGSYRTVLAFKKEQQAFFIYGFAKNVKSDMSESEKRLYRQLAKDLLNASASDIQRFLAMNRLIEVK